MKSRSETGRICLVDIAGLLPDRNKAALPGPIYATIFSLLFGLGLRVGEAARLRWGDVDRDKGVLTIHETKFSKSRLVPMGPRLANRLSAFMSMRTERTPGLTAEAPVFSFTGGRLVNPGTINQVFHALAPAHVLRLCRAQTPELLREAERVAPIPTKQTQPPATRYLERDEVNTIRSRNHRLAMLRARLRDGRGSPAHCALRGRTAPDC